MRRVALIAVTAAMVGISGTDSFALPQQGLQGSESAEAGNGTDEARVFCYNRYTGHFLHWGSCSAGRRRVRVYCRNRYTGQFIHWGAC